MMEMTSFRCYDFLGRPRLFRRHTSIFLYATLWSLVGAARSVDANFNLYMDRHEVNRTLGLFSDIYFVREGVVNEYALNFVVNIPSQIEKLHFSWQSFMKKPIHYELTIEFADFIALLQPSSNISTHGRVPQKLETFRIVLPCSGRLSTEVAVIIRFNFHMKSAKQNATVINVRRNKICLTKEFARLNNQQSTVDSDEGYITSRGNGAGGEGNSGGGGNSGINTINGNNFNSNSTLLILQDPTPSLLLAGLLGGCAVTASIVFLTFFICLRRKLVPSSSSDSSCSSTCPGPNTDPNSMSNNSSPACLLRQNPSESKWITLPGSHSGGSMTKDNFCSNNLLEPLQAQSHHQIPHQLHQHPHVLRSSSPMSRSWSRNSYVTIASFWNDIFTTGIPGGQQQSNNCHNNSSRASKVSNSTFLPGNRTSTNSNNTSSTTTKGSDVSPYAYAHILGIPPPTPPMISLAGSKLGSTVAMSQNQHHQQQHQPSPLTIPSQHQSMVNPHLLEWYSQPPPQPCTSLPGGGHIYSNHLYTFNPSPNNVPFISQQQLHSPKHSIMSHMSPPPPPMPPLPPTTPPIVQTTATNTTTPVGPDCGASIDGNSSTAGRSGSESLIQIDGFQCRKNFTKETDVVERFL
ncbi:unnamed protein product [Orchesella dallaii]|uniref:WIF domain-containing protein n=1 Tax=Orchesella dallaii TaxID=48710 RepID=A0ABP1RGD3_9HEXA